MGKKNRVRRDSLQTKHQVLWQHSTGKPASKPQVCRLEGPWHRQGTASCRALTCRSNSRTHAAALQDRSEDRHTPRAKGSPERPAHCRALAVLWLLSSRRVMSGCIFRSVSPYPGLNGTKLRICACHHIPLLPGYGMFCPLCLRCVPWAVVK